MNQSRSGRVRRGQGDPARRHQIRAVPAGFRSQPFLEELGRPPLSCTGSSDQGRHLAGRTGQRGHASRRTRTPPCPTPGRASETPTRSVPESRFHRPGAELSEHADVAEGIALRRAVPQQDIHSVLQERPGDSETASG